jgi:hypothetical protein
VKAIANSSALLDAFAALLYRAKTQESISASTAPQLTREGGPGSGPRKGGGSAPKNEDPKKALASAHRELYDAQNAAGKALAAQKDIEYAFVMSKDKNKGDYRTDPAYLAARQAAQKAVAAHHRASKKYQKAVALKKAATPSVGSIYPMKKKESEALSNAGRRFKESNSGGAVATDGKRFSVVLIKEGLGNLKDLCYYTREALAQAAAEKVFEGKKLYIDHPSETDEVNRPERSVRDVAGYFENVTFQVVGDRAQLGGDLVVLPGAAFDAARTLMKESVAYSLQHPGDLIGLSINASGDADEKDLEAFLKESAIPAEVMPKFLKAKEQGATVVRVVNKIESAVSCDLVTEAGAGGRVVKILEQEKVIMKKKIVESEAAKHESEEKKVEGEEAHEAVGAETPAQGGEEEAPAADAAHADAAQDKELIKKMIAKHMGDGGGFDEADEAACEAAHKMACEAGMEGEEAEKAACYSMKLAKHAKGKMEAEAMEAEEKKESGAAELTPPVHGVSPGKPGPIGKEAEAVVKLTAENTKLRESLKKFELEKALDKTLRESGLPMSATKEFRKLVVGCKSEKEISEKFQVFSEAYKLGGGEAGGLAFVITPEKQETEFGSSNALSFEDCTE